MYKGRLIGFKSESPNTYALRQPRMGLMLDSSPGLRAEAEVAMKSDLGIEVTGALTALLLILLFVRLLTGRLVLPAKVYAVLSWMGFVVYVGFLISSGQGSLPSGSVLAEIWVMWLMIAPVLLPLISGLLGWAALRSRWRWGFLGAGFGLLVLPWVVMVAVR